MTDVEYASTLAWIYRVDVGSVGGFQQHVEAALLANPAIPKVLFHPLARGGWKRRAVAHAACAGGALRGASRHLHQQRPAASTSRLASRRGRPPSSGRLRRRPEPGPRRWSRGSAGARPVVVAVATRWGCWSSRRCSCCGRRPGPGSIPTAGWCGATRRVAGNLNTNAAPSWKPLPYLFTVPVRAVRPLPAVAVDDHLAGGVAERRGVRRPDRLPADRRRRPTAAGPRGSPRPCSPARRCSGSSDYWHYILSAQSDPMIVALCLGAIDCHLSGRYRWAFVLGRARRARAARGVAVPRRCTRSGPGCACRRCDG